METEVSAGGDGVSRKCKRNTEPVQDPGSNQGDDNGRDAMPEPEPGPESPSPQLGVDPEPGRPSSPSGVSSSGVRQPSADPSTQASDGAGRTELNASGYPVQSFAWQLGNFETLQGEQGWAYYETIHGSPSDDTNLIEYSSQSWPRVEDLVPDTWLMSTNPKTLRHKPINGGIPTDYDRRQCFVVLGKGIYFFEQQTSSRSGGWVPLEARDCPQA